MLILSRVLRHQCLRRSPSCLTLTLCHCPLRGPLSISTFHTLIPHTKWAGDHGGNGFDNSQTAWNKQRNWIRWNSSVSADHVIQKSLPLGIFSSRLAIHKYSTHLQERKRDCGELSPSLPSPSHIQSCRALCLRSYISHFTSGKHGLYFSELLVESCRLHPGYRKGPY